MHVTYLTCCNVKCRKQPQYQFYLHAHTSVGLEPKIPKELQHLYFGTENVEQLRLQSIEVPIPKLQVPPDLELKWNRNGTEMEPN